MELEEDCWYSHHCQMRVWTEICWSLMRYMYYHLSAKQCLPFSVFLRTKTAKMCICEKFPLARRIEKIVNGYKVFNNDGILTCQKLIYISLWLHLTKCDVQRVK